MTVVVTDLDAARRFFGLLGFVERVAVVASGEEIARYMGIPDWEADHVTLVLEGAPVHQEVQLLRFHHPAAAVDTGAGTLARTGFNHVCFRVNDLDAMLAHLSEHGITSAQRRHGVPRPAPGLPRRSGRRRRAGRVDEWACRPGQASSMSRPEGWQSGRMHSS